MYNHFRKNIFNFILLFSAVFQAMGCYAESNVPPKNINDILLVSRYDYEDIKTKLTTEDLPLLYEILETSDYHSRWPNIAFTIGMLGENKESYIAICNYIQRVEGFTQSEEFTEFNGMRFSSILGGKTHAIRWLPFLDPTDGSNVLTDILTRKDAPEEYLKAWNTIDIPYGYGDIRRARVDLRGQAARGLILFDAHKYTYLVQKEFERADQIVAQIPAPGEVELTDDEYVQNGYKAMLLTSLGMTLAWADYIKVHGTEKYLSTITLPSNDLGFDGTPLEVEFNYRKIMKKSSFP